MSLTLTKTKQTSFVSINIPLVLGKRQHFGTKPKVSNHEENIQGKGKNMHVVFQYMSRSLG
jgi:hypothetical protein